MLKKIVLVTDFVIVENESDLFFVFDTEYLKIVSNFQSNLNLETNKNIFTFKDESKIPVEKLKVLNTVPILINDNRNGKDGKKLIEAFVI